MRQLRRRAVLERRRDERGGSLCSVRGWLFPDGPGRVVHRQLQRVRGRELLDHRRRDRGISMRQLRRRAVLERRRDERGGSLCSVRGWLFPDGPWRVVHRQLQRVRAGDLLDHGGRDVGVGMHPMCAGEVLERLWHGRASVVHIVRGGLFLDGPGRDQQQRLQRVRRRDLLDQRGR
jgi:hypothetical protein